MRGRLFIAVAVLVLPLLAGCVGEDDAPTSTGPRSPASEASERTFTMAQKAARDSVGGDNLVTAFTVVASRPGQLESISADFPGIAGLAQKMIAEPGAVPGDGTVKTWAFVYQSSPGAATLQTVLVTESDDEDYELTEGSMDRSELLLLRVGRSMESPAPVPPADALEAARGDTDWNSKTTRSGIFMIYILQADASGDPEWRLIISESEPLSGQSVIVHGATGELKGSAEPWPERLIKEADVRGQEDVNTQIPGDQMTFPLKVQEDNHPRFHVLPTRTGTGAIIGDPVVALHSPGGESQSITYDQWHVEEAPQSGDWTVEYTWELPDLYRSIRIEYCLQPVPFLFAERVDACEPGG